MLRRSSAGIVILLVSSSPLFAQPSLTPSAPAAPAAPAAESRELMPSFGSLFRDVARDFRNLPSTETALILGLGGAASASVHSQDQRITRGAAGSAPLEEVFEPGATLGGAAVQVGGAFATYAIGRMVHSPRVAMVGGELVRAQMLTAAMTQGLKFSVGRTRPDGTRYSFPSGHSSATFATATVLQRNFGWKVGIPAYGFAAFIAGSRLQANRHYASDVLFGAAIGIVGGRTVTIGHGNKRFALAPIAAPGGAGVGVSWVSPH